MDAHTAIPIQESAPNASQDHDELRQTIARAEARISSVREFQELEQERDHLNGI